jgi:uncharacterized phage protein (TIGR01671 family)
MREILFRGKRTDTGEWVEGYFCKTRIKDTCYITQSEGGDCCNEYFVDYEVIPETVGQYTGLEDRNGKKIFEGDILKNEDGYVYDGEYKTEVAYFLGEFCGLGFCNIDPSDFKYCEVIGNIHDNPELLEGNK